jgi:hypothetical protein
MSSTLKKIQRSGADSAESLKKTQIVEITSKLKIKKDTLVVINDKAETSLKLDLIGIVQFQIINKLYNCTLKTCKGEYILGFILTESDFKIFETAMKNNKTEFRSVKALVRDDN